MKRLVRCLLVVWGAPMTLAGLVLVLLARPRYLCLGGPYRAMCFLAREGSWLAQWMDSGNGGAVRGGIAAVTCGEVIVLRRAEWLTRRLVTHESRHVLQGYALGILQPVAYALLSVAAWAHGQELYHDNALERDARVEAGEPPV